MWNAALDEAQAGIKTAGRNIYNLRYADNTILMAESKEELKGLVIKVKEETEKAALKLNIQKTKIRASSPITSWQIDGETMETVRDTDNIQYTALMYSFPDLEPACCFMSGSSCCFLTSIQILQEAGKVFSSLRIFRCLLWST